MKVKGIKLFENLSPNGEYHRVRKHLQKVAEAYRKCDKVADSKDAFLLSDELKSYNALNINNGSGRFVVVL